MNLKRELVVIKMGISNSGKINAHPSVRQLKSDIHVLRPMLQYEEFRLKDIETPTNENGNYPDGVESVLRKALMNGALKKVEREEFCNANSRWKYRWAQGVRERLTEYVDDMAQLPCGCRAHIPPGRDAPDGYRTCKYCGAIVEEELIKDSMP